MPSHPHPLRRASRACALCLAAAGATGCFGYQSLPANTPPGLDVRVSLDPTAVASLEGALGPRASLLEGRLVGRTDSTVTVAVRAVTRIGGDEERWSGDPVAVPLRAVERVERRRFDVFRTALAAGGVVAAAVLAGRLAGEGEGGGGRVTVPSPPQ